MTIRTRIWASLLTRSTLKVPTLGVTWCGSKGSVVQKSLYEQRGDKETPNSNAACLVDASFDVNLNIFIHFLKLLLKARANLILTHNSKAAEKN